MQKQLSRVSAVLVLALFVILRSPVSATGADGAKVMILGVSHFVARRDNHNSVFVDNPLSSTRQAQVADVIDHLARFRPTKVLIEAPMGDLAYTMRYRRFLAGRFRLPADEVYQYGFKLAARAANRTIFPIDTFGPTLLNDDARIDDYQETHFASVSDPADDASIAREDRLERDGTYLDLLRYLNRDDAIRANASWYSVFVGMGRTSHNAGSAYVSQWYARNCYIFSNILSVVRPGDRIVVIMGARSRVSLARVRSFKAPLGGRRSADVFAVRDRADISRKHYARVAKSSLGLSERTVKRARAGGPPE